ncbi:MAG: LytTR family DNA-binding domain-containing protein [Bacteroidales bacterium]|jgi:DNA-binding LytR/AlgR family response regulator|nr:LytTR family DNA-binding domain-containing protein [Bacteroidales bacterium]
MHKIIIVDDVKPARNFIAELVSFYIPNAKVTQIDHPQKALTRFQNEDYDMLFLDIRMPGMNGLELLEQIQLLGRDPYTVIISAHSEFDYAVKGIELGVINYVVKPLHKEKIFEVIQNYLKKMETDVIELKIPYGIRRVKIAHILAVETIERGKVKLFTTTGTIPCAISTLSKLFEALPPQFQYIRRDCIVNRHTISGINHKSNEVIVRGKEEEFVFKASRERIQEVRGER